MFCPSPISQHPRTDPRLRLARMRFLPWRLGVEAQVGIRMKFKMLHAPERALWKNPISNLHKPTSATCSFYFSGYLLSR